MGETRTKRQLEAELAELKKLASAACQWCGHYDTIQLADDGKTWIRTPMGNLWRAIGGQTSWAQIP